MLIDNQTEMYDFLMGEFPNEGCGVVVNNTFIPCDNASGTPVSDFKIRQPEYLRHCKEGELQAVVHSHTTARERSTKERAFDLRTPSMQDMIGQKNTAVPWGICATDGDSVTPCLWLGSEEAPAPLLGRQYIPNYHDCVSLMNDYITMNYDHIKAIESIPKTLEWSLMDKSLIINNVENVGFVQLPQTTTIDDLKPGDGILFQIRASYVNHLGVYIGDGMMYHHLIGRLSNEDSLYKWQKQVVGYIRHREIV